MIKHIIDYDDYKNALIRLFEIFDAPSGTTESREADELVQLIDDYEKKNNPEFE